MHSCKLDVLGVLALANDGTFDGGALHSEGDVEEDSSDSTDASAATRSYSSHREDSARIKNHLLRRSPRRNSQENRPTSTQPVGDLKQFSEAELEALAPLGRRSDGADVTSEHSLRRDFQQKIETK